MALKDQICGLCTRGSLEQNDTKRLKEGKICQAKAKRNKAGVTMLR